MAAAAATSSASASEVIVIEKNDRKNEEEDEEEVALVEDNVVVDDDADVNDVERSRDPTNDEFINFIVPDCLSQHENSKNCFFDNNDGKSSSSSGNIKDPDIEEEDEEFFTPILPSNFEAAGTASATSLKRTTPSLIYPPSKISKIFPTLSATITPSPSHSNKSKSCVTGTITLKSDNKFVFVSTKAANELDKFNSNTDPRKSLTQLEDRSVILSSTLSTSPSTVIHPTTLATKPSIEIFPALKFSSLHAKTITTPGAYPFLFTSTLSPLLSSTLLPSTTPLSMGQASLKFDDFPRTPLILTASGFVIISIAVIVFWVFCCRQSAPMDLKHATTATTTTIPNGYTAIPVDSFREPRNPSSQICPINDGIQPRSSAAPTGTSMAQNQNHHQQMPSDDIFKKSSSTMPNNNNNNGISISSNGHHHHHHQNHKKVIEKRKSDYKEWYV